MNGKNSVLLELHYLPSLEYFACLNSFENIILEQHEHYAKQSYRNRCYVLGANKTEILSVPVYSGNKKMIRDVKIDYSKHWNLIHWRTLEAAYRKTPFFEYFADYFWAVYEQKPTFLWDLNYELLTVCLKLLKIKKSISFTESYEKTLKSEVFDARSLFFPSKKNELSIFNQPKPYLQNFGSEFVPNLSIVDFLFCKGTFEL